MRVMIGVAISEFVRFKRFIYGGFAIGFCFLVALAAPLPLLAEETESNVIQTARTSLSGIVTSEKGEPIQGAVVVIEGVIARSKEPELTRRSAPECLQSAYTDDSGRFVLSDLNPKTRYRLRIAKRSYESQVVSDVDADSQDLKISLVPAPPVSAKESTVTIDVVDENGRPIGAAMVRPRGYERGNEGMIGPLEKIAGVQVTNSKGLCDITAVTPVDSLSIEVRAKGFATCYADKVPTGQNEVQTIRLDRGVTIVGQVFHEGRPLPGVIMCIVPIPRTTASYHGPWEGITDSEGTFSIANVTANSDVFVYGRMDSFGVHQAALAAMQSSTESNNTTLDIGKLVTEKGHKVAGRVRLKNGKPLPEGWRVVLTRKDLDDANSIRLPADGSFVAKYVPTGVCSINVYGPETEALTNWPFHLSQENSNLDPTNPFGLVGRIEGDTQLTLLLESGPTTLFEMPETEPEIGRLSNKLDQLLTSPIAGVSE